MKRFELVIESRVVLTVDQIWPDGNAPADPTAKDVLELNDDDGGPETVLREWNLPIAVSAREVES